MLVLILERAPPKVIGYCSSWALQVAPGVFVANLPSRTRESMWEQIEAWADDDTRAILVWSTRETEQGLRCRTHGHPRRQVVDREGLLISSWIPADVLASADPE